SFTCSSSEESYRPSNSSHCSTRTRTRGKFHPVAGPSSIVAEGKRETERVMERAESNFRLGLQTRELVIPSKDSNWQDLLYQSERADSVSPESAPNRLVYG